MNNFSACLLFIILFTGILMGCSSNQVRPALDAPTGIDEVLVWSSETKRPGWTMEEPDKLNGLMSFVGLSATHATEKNARNDARRNANSNVVAYTGTLAKNKFENARVDYGLESSVIDPTKSARQFEKQLATNIVNKVKPKKWYAEKWKTNTGIGYRVFVLAQVPEEVLEQSYVQTARDMAKNAEKRVKAAADKLAKEQAEKATEFWKQMESQGLVE